MAFDVNYQSFLQGLESAQQRVVAAVDLYADTAGKKLEAEAKANAPWVDRSGNARRTMTGGHKWRGNTCFIYVCGNMNYSVFLEYCHEGRFAVLFPTIRRLEPEIMRGFERMLDRC